MSDRQPFSMYALDRFWDDLVRGQALGATADPALDPNLAEAVRQLHQLALPPAEAPAFGPRLWESLLAEYDARGGVTRGASPANRPGPPRPVRGDQGWTTPVMGVGRFVTAAMLAAVLILLIVKTLGPWDQNGGGGPGVATPSALPAMTAAAGYAVDQVYQVTFPGGSLPPGTPILTLMPVRYAPGSLDSTYGIKPAAGFGFEVVTAGVYWNQAGIPVVVLRAPGGRAETIPADTRVTLNTGDILVYNTTQIEHHHGNSSDGEARLLWLLMNVPYASDPATMPATPVIGEISIDSQFSASLSPANRAAMGVDAGAVTVSVRQITVAPGAVLPPQTDTGCTIRFVLSGAATWGIVEPGAATPATWRTAFSGLAIVHEPLQPGEHIAVGNTADKPLVLYEITITPAAPDATPVAP